MDKCAAHQPPSGYSSGALVADVAADGIAAAVGIAPGDRIMSVDGATLSDILDYQFRTSPAEILLRVVRPGGQEWEASIEKDEGEPLGIVLAEELFEPARSCQNNCSFCFVSGLPRGMRNPLYFRDDDLRLSVLHGNFITLTNFTETDWARLRVQRLSPLHVSIHTTDDALRRRMLGNSRAPEIMPQLRELLRLGIEVHGQIVLCRGINDGAALEATLRDLLSLERPLASLAVVPVGITRWTDPGVLGYDAEDARAVLAMLGPWQLRYASAGSGLWAADEWYLKAELPLPRWSEYGAFPQLANGVGMARDFIRGLRLATRRLPVALPVERRVILATGTLFAPVLRSLVEERLDGIAGLTVEVVGCANGLFGGEVSVAGLLGGLDIIKGVRAHGACLPVPDEFIVPGAILRDAGDLTLDDMDLDMLAGALGTAVTACDTPGEMIRALIGRRAAQKGGSRG